MLSELLNKLDEAVTEAEKCKGEADAAAAASVAAQTAHEQAVGVVLELQAKLRERLGPVVGGASARVRQ